MFKMQCYHQTWYSLHSNHNNCDVEPDDNDDIKIDKMNPGVIAISISGLPNGPLNPFPCFSYFFSFFAGCRETWPSTDFLRSVDSKPAVSHFRVTLQLQRTFIRMYLFNFGTFPSFIFQLFRLNKVTESNAL